MTSTGFVDQTVQCCPESSVSVIANWDLLAGYHAEDILTSLSDPVSGVDNDHTLEGNYNITVNANF